MSDLSDLQAALSTKIVGSTSSGLETTAVNSSNNGDLCVVDGLSGTGLNGALSVPTANTAVEVKVGASKLVDRKSITFQATDNDFYWGYSSSVTVANGTLIRRGWFAEWSCDPSATTPLQVWVVCATSSVNGRVTEAM